MNPIEQDIHDATIRMEKRGMRAAYRRRQLLRWLDRQPDEIRERWKGESHEQRET